MGRFFAAVYEPLTRGAERRRLGEIRDRLLAGLSGRVLEIGAGTGYNFAHYPAGVEVVATEPDPFMLRKAERRRSAARVPIDLRRADAQDLPFPDGAFDAAVGTLVFCSIPDPARAFRELRRVVRPGGPVRLLEHVRSERPGVARIQHALTPVWHRLFDNCHLNRDTLAALQDAGLTVESVRRHSFGIMPALEIYART